MCISRVCVCVCIMVINLTIFYIRNYLIIMFVYEKFISRNESRSHFAHSFIGMHVTLVLGSMGSCMKASSS